MVAIIDYGMGNLTSVAKAIKALGFRPIIASHRAELVKAEKIILPGVGHFGKAVEELKKRKIFSVLRELVKEKKVKFLGICLGLQLIFSESEEAEGEMGLNFFGRKSEKISFGCYCSSYGMEQGKI